MLRHRAALTACVTLIAGAITSVGVSTPAQAAPPTCDAVTAWSDLQVCFDTATGTTGNPTPITLGADLIAPTYQSLAVPAGKAITLDLAGHDLTITNPGLNRPAISAPTAPHSPSTTPAPAPQP